MNLPCLDDRNHLVGLRVSCAIACRRRIASVNAFRAAWPEQSWLRLPASLSPHSSKTPGAIRVQTIWWIFSRASPTRTASPLPDLTQDAFKLSEQGVPQKIERFEAETNRPLDLALMVDSSMSAFKDMKFETEAAAHFIRQVVRPAIRLGVFEF